MLVLYRHELIHHDLQLILYVYNLVMRLGCCVCGIRLLLTGIRLLIGRKRKSCENQFIFVTHFRLIETPNSF